MLNCQSPPMFIACEVIMCIPQRDCCSSEIREIYYSDLASYTIRLDLGRKTCQCSLNNLKATALWGEMKVNFICRRPRPAPTKNNELASQMIVSLSLVHSSSPSAVGEGLEGRDQSHNLKTTEMKQSLLATMEQHVNYSETTT